MDGIFGVYCFCRTATCGMFSKSQGVKTDRSDKKQLKIGFTIDTLVLERWTRDRDVFTAVAQELGAQVDVQNANNNLEKQKKQIEDFICTEDGRNRDRCSGFLWTDGRGG